jgi:hypothetical protein
MGSVALCLFSLSPKGSDLRAKSLLEGIKHTFVWTAHDQACPGPQPFEAAGWGEVQRAWNCLRDAIVLVTPAEAYTALSWSPGIFFATRDVGKSRAAMHFPSWANEGSR